MNFKGELTTTELAGIILVIASFVVLFIFYVGFNFGGVIDSESCHASVVLRGTVIDLAKSYTPLNCQTEKICITTSGLLSGSCDEYFSGVKSVTKAKISSDVFYNDGQNNAKTEIEKLISEEVVDCWTMMGSGKISIQNNNLMTQYGLTETEPFCVICSRISVDDSVKESLGITDETLATLDPYEYMRTHKFSGQEVSYLDYILGTGVGGKGASFSLDNSKVQEFDSASQKLYAEQKKKFGELAVVFMQVYTPSTGEVFDNYLKTMLGTGIASYAVSPTLAGMGTKIGVELAVKFPALTLSALAIAAGYVTLNTWSNQELTISYCGDISGANKISKGCSVVRVVPYNSDSINQYCGVIDGLP